MWNSNLREYKGLTLMELIISLGMLSLLLILIFSTFELGTRLFRDTTTRQNTETELRGIKLMLERDVNLSNFWYSDSEERAVDLERRDALSLSSLSNWDDPALYDPVTKRPAWNRYTVWYATMEAKGRLIRQAVEPSLGGAAYFTQPYGALKHNLNDNPLSNSSVVYSRELTRDLKEFQADMRLQNGTVEARLRLHATGTQRPQTGVKTEDHLEVTLVLQPKNSWPAI